MQSRSQSSFYLVLKLIRNERRGGWNIIILCKYYLIIELSWNSHLHGYLIYERVIKILHHYASSIIFIYVRLYYIRFLRNGYLLHVTPKFINSIIAG